MAGRPTASTIDDYISGFEPATREVLEELRALIHQCAPEATETISYAIPTFDLNGKHLVHFAAFTHHVGFYPTSSPVKAFAEDLRPYRTARGSVQFPLGQPLPLDLIRRMVEFRVRETAAGAAAPPAR